MVVQLLLMVVLALVTAPRVGVVVDARVAGELVGAGELLAAAGELAGVGLLASVGANVPRLMLKAVEGLVAERALVGAGQLVGVLRRLGAGDGPVGLEDGDGGASHVGVVILLSGFVEVVTVSPGGGIQQIGEIHCRLCSLHVIGRWDARAKRVCQRTCVLSVCRACGRGDEGKVEVVE